MKQLLYKRKDFLILLQRYNDNELFLFLTKKRMNKLVFVSEKVKEHFDLEGEWRVLAGELDENYRLMTSKESFIVKISHKEEDEMALHFQHRMMEHLYENASGLEIPFYKKALSGNDIVRLRDGRFLRVLTWVKGKLWAKTNPQSDLLLDNLGQKLGQLSLGLVGFEAAFAKRFLKWDLQQVDWIAPQLDLFEGEEARLIRHFYDYHKAEISPKMEGLRKSLIQGDANDYNIVVNEDARKAEVVGFIDFGDAVYSHTINELAIALAYVMMDKPDPIGAGAKVVAAYHRVFSLEEKELSVLFGQVIARLLISLTASAINKKELPENEYLLISETPAWALLRKLEEFHPEFVLAAFRAACGWEAQPKRALFDTWLATKGAFHQLVDLDLAKAKIKKLDLTVGSLDLGHNRDFEDTDLFEKKLESLLDGYDVGLGGYGECRPVYTTDAYLEEGNNGPRWRSMHIGLDVWMDAGRPVFAPLDGIVHSFKDNASDRDYGPCLILEHQLEDFTFYSLYGHLSRSDMQHWELGKRFKAGAQIATIGPCPENGAWPPHLHFQLMLDMLGNEGDFPGVAFPEEEAIWKSICPDPNLIFACTLDILPKGSSIETLLGRRNKSLGKSLSISYQKPLHITRGHLQYLYTAEGRRYLDTVNNVPHIGHQHWEVVRAIQTQAAVLNTNTRYLHQLILDYSEQLAACFPKPLEVVFLVNSGSEANELALRMAKTITGQKDMIALEVGYHGNTNGTVDVSSYKFDGKGGEGAPTHTHIVPMPDVYRGLYRGTDAASKYAASVEGVIEELTHQGRRPAGFIAEAILSCGGQVVPPKGYFKSVFKAVRKAGGLCIMDEVQVGFGRVGDAFWGFELHAVVPDIVTLGKPIANGHPMAAVVTTRAIADAFANGMEYFSTFGGNPVSCAAAKAVLDVVQGEKLQAHAKEVGDYLRAGYQDLMNDFSIIGDVRGHGLFLGFELVKDRSSQAPFPEAAKYIANRMRALGILMSTDGPFHNVIKTKPPMCFNRKNADFVLETLRKVLAEDALNVK